MYIGIKLFDDKTMINWKIKLLNSSQKITALQVHVAYL